MPPPGVKILSLKGPPVAWVTRQPDGSFNVQTFGRVKGGGFDSRQDVMFILVVF